MEPRPQPQGAAAVPHREQPDAAKASSMENVDYNDQILLLLEVARTQQELLANLLASTSGLMKVLVQEFPELEADYEARRREAAQLVSRRNIEVLRRIEYAIAGLRQLPKAS